MNIERLQDLKRAVEQAISYQGSGGTTVDMTEDETSRRFIHAGAVPGVHHLVIGQFAVTDLDYQQRESELLATIQKLRADNEMLMSQLTAVICPARQ